MFANCGTIGAENGVVGCTATGVVTGGNRRANWNDRNNTAGGTKKLCAKNPPKPPPRSSSRDSSASQDGTNRRRRPRKDSAMVLSCGKPLGGDNRYNPIWAT